MLQWVYGYDDQSIWVVSSQYEDVKGLKLTTKIYNLDWTEKFSQQNPVDAGADSTAKIFTLPDVQSLSATYFLVLRLEDEAGKIVGSKLYLLSTQPQTLDWAQKNRGVTPTASYSPFTPPPHPPQIKLQTTQP